MRSDLESDWPDRLLQRLAAAPLVAEVDLSHRYIKPGAALTAGELDTLRAIAHGMREKEAAALLCVSHDAVKDRLRQARRKLRAKTTTHAVAHAIWQGLIAAPPREDATPAGETGA